MMRNISARYIQKRFASEISNSEAFVETIRSRGVTDMFGIVGSAFMDPLDLFPDAGIRFISTQHEQGSAHMADGYARVTGKHGVCIAQNGPGITNFVTGVAAAWHGNSPVVAITPEAATNTKGLGGFQEVDQLPFFEPVTKEQVHVCNPDRMAELTGFAFDSALREQGPVQLNIPRDYFYGTTTKPIPRINVPERSAGGKKSLAEAVKLIANARNPVILAGGGAVHSNAQPALKELAEFLQVPVATTYLHNDAYDCNSPLWVGPLGYCGHKSAMHAVKDCDVLIAIGTRLGPFGTNPQYGMDYWPQNASVIQVDIDGRKIGRCKDVEVGICGDATLATEELFAQLKGMDNIKCLENTAERLAKVKESKEVWEAELTEMSNANIHASEESGRIVPRKALRALENGMPSDAIVATDIGNICSVSNGYLRFAEPRSYLAALTFGNCGYAIPAAMGAKVGRPDRPVVAYVGDGAFGMSMNELLTCARENIPITVVTFNNMQWGAEKKNQVIWFGDRYVGTNLKHPAGGLANMGVSMGLNGVTITDCDDIEGTLKKAIDDQMERGIATVIEIIVTRELGDPFRRDAMRLPKRLMSKYSGTTCENESPTGQPIDLLNYDKN
eukprot:TRINITY_DN2665_c0_g1_i1.p1 TRINITY_DN2665_c0_g1~~TRINITY_DN2665_c0_g1_i1.p1  ORF type:complete len:647 (+),score=173.27 TRINITY_DN2665_c0_g1_i1:99-1943(+)